MLHGLFIPPKHPSCQPLEFELMFIHSLLMIVMVTVMIMKQHGPAEKESANICLKKMAAHGLTRVIVKECLAGYIHMCQSMCHQSPPPTDCARCRGLCISGTVRLG